MRWQKSAKYYVLWAVKDCRFCRWPLFVRLSSLANKLRPRTDNSRHWLARFVGDVSAAAAAGAAVRWHRRLCFTVSHRCRWAVREAVRCRLQEWRSRSPVSKILLRCLSSKQLVRSHYRSFFVLSSSWLPNSTFAASDRSTARPHSLKVCDENKENSLSCCLLRSYKAI